MDARTREIVEYAGTLFDVAVVRKLTGGWRLLLLGLESTAERDLDEFGRDEHGRFAMRGFEKHTLPRLTRVLEHIRSQGYTAGPLGRYGYPLAGEINLKVEAIRAGVGRRGKNTIVLHPKYGTRLRFIAVGTDAPLKETGKSAPHEEENPMCKDCSICIDKCPTGVLAPYRMLDPSRCLSDSDNMEEESGRLMPCDLCLKMCPMGKDSRIQGISLPTG